LEDKKNPFGTSGQNSATYRMPGFEMEDPEEEARALQMRRNIEDKAREEDEKKSERRLRAAQTLKQMQSERLAAVEKKKRNKTMQMK